MKCRKFKVGTWREVIAWAAAVVFVALCAISVTSRVSVCSDGDGPPPYISLVDGNFSGEVGISAGFSIPTNENVRFHATVPHPEYDIGVVDIRTINVFREGDRTQIVANIDLLSDVMDDNAIGEMFLSAGKNLAKMDISIGADRTEMEDLITGNRHFFSFPRECAADGSAIALKSGNMIFLSPCGIFDPSYAELFANGWDNRTSFSGREGDNRASLSGKGGNGRASFSANGGENRASFSDNGDRVELSRSGGDRTSLSESGDRVWFLKARNRAVIPNRQY
jgi:hypothetical protein